MTGIVISMILVLAVLNLMVHQGEAVDCRQVTTLLMPCDPYLTGMAAEPVGKCCSGVSEIKALTPTTEDRQGACECVKTAAGHLPDIDQTAAAALPSKCKIDIGIPISPDTNCQE
ncbi:non-specific lipid-transfer protein A-like [Argentina anserina]|uniref:non-specific lipid-transfer protein A-like n=1 Tax=Argentina anserina TaxID=57926 RepID=UPI0021769508|nr:non-specific lipid-transfer protein A-like [Potentilla anserina]